MPARLSQVVGFDHLCAGSLRALRGSQVTRARALAEASRERRKRLERRVYLRWASGDRCSTCAYRQGTEASGDDVDQGLTRVRRALLDAAQPFYCHEPGPIAASAKKRLCIGHMDAMSARTRAGYYDRHPPGAPEVVAELREATRVRDEIYHQWELQQREPRTEEISK